MKLEELNKKYTQLETEYNLILNSINVANKQHSKARKNYIAAMKAREFFKNVAKRTQSKIEAYVSTLVTMALKAVFPEPYEFVMRFVERRNKTECDLIFIKDGEEYVPKESSGGGPLDVASLVLRVACWSFRRNRAIMILDEPGKYVSVDLQERFIAIIKTISKKMHLQFIIMSHQEPMIVAADKAFQVVRGKVKEIHV